MNKRELISASDPESAISWEVVRDELRFLKESFQKGRYNLPGQMAAMVIEVLDQRLAFAIAKVELAGKQKTPAKQESALKKMTGAGVRPRKIGTLLRYERASLCSEYCCGGKKCAHERGCTVQNCSKKEFKL